MKDKSLEVIVTSGGTISPVDDVRHIGNFASGETGAKIAEEFLRRGHKVHYVYGHNALLPFKRNSALDYNKVSLVDKKAEMEQSYVDWHLYSSQLELHSTPTFDDYYKTLWGILVKRNVDAVVSAAAVNDYRTKKVDGKISSDRESLILELEKCPKVISKFKQWHPLVYQVGFKLLSGISEKELVDTAYEHGRKNRSNFTVANLKENLDGTTYLVYPTYKYDKINRNCLPLRIVENVEGRR